jgi:hypothetical protein
MTVTLRQATLIMGMAAIALSGFALGWWQDSDPGRGAPAKDAAAEWKPFKPRMSDPLAEARILSAKAPFGETAQLATAAPAAAGMPAAGPPKWRVGGIVTTEKRQYLIVLVRKPGQNLDRAETRYIGESLPDGSVVRTIEPTRITVDREGKIATIKIFAQR